MKLIFFAVAWIILFLLSLPVNGQRIKAKLENQFSGWTTLNFSDPLQYQFGARYIPVFSISDSLAKSRMIDVEISFNSFGNLMFRGSDYNNAEKDLQPYRFWLRYSTSRLELRAGLQKINFGSASMLRPLMWFDKMDARDPLQLTEGVYGLLGRYYFTNNANIWLWTIYGDHKKKGWEIVPTKKGSPEYGGRFQLPVPGGEAAISYHSRVADYSYFYKFLPFDTLTQFREDKVGFDGKWDLEVGLWVEYVIKHNDYENGILDEWETYSNLGLDYTLPAGNGLNFTMEYFRYNSKSDWNKKGTHNNLSAVTFNYPFGLMNTILAMFFYNWDQKEWYRFVSLQRKYDYWSFYLMAFWNPEQFKLYNSAAGRNFYAGKGIQFMAVVYF